MTRGVAAALGRRAKWQNNCSRLGCLRCMLQRSLGPVPRRAVLSAEVTPAHPDRLPANQPTSMSIIGHNRRNDTPQGSSTVSRRVGRPKPLCCRTAVTSAVRSPLAAHRRSSFAPRRTSALEGRVAWYQHAPGTGSTPQRGEPADPPPVARCRNGWIHNLNRVSVPAQAAAS